MREHLLIVAVLSLVASACAQAESSSEGPGANVPTAYHADVEASVRIDADGCIVFEADVAGHEPYERSTCVPGYFSTVAEGCLISTSTGTGPGISESALSTIPCDTLLPRFLYGWAPPAIGWLCLADLDESGIGPVRFVSPAEDGLFLEALGTATASTPFPFTPDGAHWGEPPLDGPASSIYDLCDAAGPWTGTVPTAMNVLILVRVDRSLVPEVGPPDQVGDDTMGLSLDAGAGPNGFTFGAFDDQTLIDPALTLLSTSTGIAVELFDMEKGTETPVGTYPLPGPILDELRSGWLCPDSPMVVLDIAGSILSADPASITIDWLGATEASELLGWGLGTSTRAPGDPCPETGIEIDATRPDSPGRVTEATLMVEASEAFLMMEDWVLAVSVDGSGWILGSADLRDPEPLEGAYLPAGGTIEIGIEPQEPEAELGPDTVSVPLPDRPAGLDPPFLLVVGIDGEAGDPPEIGEVTLRWATTG